MNRIEVGDIYRTSGGHSVIVASIEGERAFMLVGPMDRQNRPYWTTLDEIAAAVKRGHFRKA